MITFLRHRRSWLVLLLGMVVSVLVGYLVDSRAQRSLAGTYGTQIVGPPNRGHQSRTSLGRYDVRYVTAPAVPPFNQPFELDVQVTPLRDAPRALPKVQVTARMPQHNHGMTNLSHVDETGTGRYRVMPMLFHMRGRWQFVVDVTADGVTDRASFDVVVS